MERFEARPALARNSGSSSRLKRLLTAVAHLRDQVTVLQEALLERPGIGFLYAGRQGRTDRSHIPVTRFFNDYRKSGAANAIRKMVQVNAMTAIAGKSGQLPQTRLNRLVKLGGAKGRGFRNNYRAPGT